MSLTSTQMIQQLRTDFEKLLGVPAGPNPVAPVRWLRTETTES